MAKCLDKERKFWFIPLAYALLFIILGVVAIVSANRVMGMYIFVVGVTMIIEGLYEVIVGIIQQ